MFRFEAKMYQNFWHTGDRTDPLYGYGFYRVPYDYDRKPDTMTRYLDVTQFEAIHARLVFPCFDQPDMKGTIYCFHKYYFVVLVTVNVLIYIYIYI